MYEVGRVKLVGIALVVYRTGQGRITIRYDKDRDRAPARVSETFANRKMGQQAELGQVEKRNLVTASSRAGVRRGEE